MPRRVRRTSKADQSGLTICLLDMGSEKYGDSIVCRLGDRVILIDGGHMGDWKDRDGYKSIPNQLADVLGSAPPFDIDLLVMTHCHSDHIGCLPTLVQNGTLKVKHALVADETLGFGHIDGAGARPSGAVAKLATALREEDYTDLADAALESFLADAVTLEDRYGAMLKKLKKDKTKIVRYGRDKTDAIEREFNDFGLEILGPAQEQLDLCAGSIAQFTDMADNWVGRQPDADLSSVVSAYRSIMSRADAAAAFATDRPGKGAALNDQSIVLKLAVGSTTVLLGGDMQFAAPEISGLDSLMSDLVQKVNDAGPYTFIKTLHHTSYNGLNDTLIDDWTATHAFAHSGGINDATHPDAKALSTLEKNKDRLHYARTDRTGRIDVTFDGGANMAIARGDLDDFTPNGDTGVPQPGPTSAQAVLQRRAGVPGDTTEVSGVARLGGDVTKITMTFEVDRGFEQAASAAGSGSHDRRRRTSQASLPSTRSATSSDATLAGGRKLPKLLFATYRPRLENNVGSSEAAARLKLISDAGQRLLEVSSPQAAGAEIRRALSDGFRGVVLVGGYDVIPPQRLDTLPRSLRSMVGQRSSDADNFIVWSDDVYGDRDGDGEPELPVSRIPDAKSPQLLMSSAAPARTIRRPSRRTTTSAARCTRRSGRG